MKKLSLAILVILMACLHANLSGQHVATTSPLSAGDMAPPFKAFKWIKGEPVTEFKKGHVYIVEFGATWCGPCAAAIPELSGLSRKFQGKATVISAFVMEYNDDPSNTANPSYVSRVEKYVTKRGDQMDYRIAVDDPAKTLENTWLKAANKVGIPHTFVIDKEGQIAWIGSNPKLLDGVIDAVVNDKYALEKIHQMHRNTVIIK
ncbi:MAG: TlpA family protein disulfide reductase [Cyclobacteriaceae bacterium]|nr:MAG: TlpA family protein disulfide reductase [Cyclobacteriaceae bacterium]